MEEQLDIIDQSSKTTTDLDQDTLLARVSVRPPTPDKCAVCLNNKQTDIIARIDSCSHTFCYACIFEWSKVRAICPLCKQPFSVITRERFSGDIVEEIRVQAPRRAQPRSFTNINEIFNWFDRRHTQQDNTNNTYNRRSDIFRQMVYMEWLNTLQALVRRPNTRSRHSHRVSNSSPSWSNMISLDSVRRLLQRYLHQTTSDSQQSAISSRSTRQTVAFRKYIYINRLFADSPLVGHNNDTVTVRECSPAWYASNPACLHRLVPFLARELLALLWDDERTIEYLISEILTTIQLHSIRSNTLARKLNGYLGRYTKHFIHEFYTFARCPYDLAGFDRHARYPALNTPTQLTLPMTISIDDDHGNEQTPIILDETPDPSVDTVIEIVSSPQTIATESESRSSSPECEIVEYVEPNSERSPNLIVLSEDEDSDDEDNDDDGDSDDLPVQILSSRKRKHRHDQQDRRSKKQQAATTIELHSPTSIILDDDDEREHHDIHEEQIQSSDHER